eukprot:TRINITY_DN6896_c0_g1_i1.p1 TRINITY_DN6896_c0_g1~~TRINITY_DN6896_c0_g1_i1.p1  ORF type:complete len:401 (-),score=22.95 TRINITY_DN6896_c0_g1_i1:21-1223(-)
MESMSSQLNTPSGLRGLHGMESPQSPYVRRSLFSICGSMSPITPPSQSNARERAHRSRLSFGRSPSHGHPFASPGTPLQQHPIVRCGSPFQQQGHYLESPTLDRVRRKTCPCISTVDEPDKQEHGVVKKLRTASMPSNENVNICNSNDDDRNGHSSGKSFLSYTHCSAPSPINHAALVSATKKSASTSMLPNACAASPDQDGGKAQRGLPTVAGECKNGIERISAETMAGVLEGQFVDMFDRMIIFDSRFPYEFDGGHIPNALNISDPGEVKDFFVDPTSRTNKPRITDGYRVAIIFHCEFSSHRGPRLARMLRSWDREANMSRWPELFYPHVYVLLDGYKQFFEGFPTLCEPQHYIPMRHTAYEQEMKECMCRLRKGVQRQKSWSKAESKRIECGSPLA